MYIRFNADFGTMSKESQLAKLAEAEYDVLKAVELARDTAGELNKEGGGNEEVLSSMVRDYASCVNNARSKILGSVEVIKNYEPAITGKGGALYAKQEH
jgi:hypothetical protein